MCAGGVYRCLSRECYGCNGCTPMLVAMEFVVVCACGGQLGCANTSGQIPMF